MLELADTSAWIWSRRQPSLRHSFGIKGTDLEIATCDMVKMELLYSTRNAKEFQRIRLALDLLPQCSIGPQQWKRALDVYEELSGWGGSHHRLVGHADLLIAAAAESAGIPVLHYDEDFERIAEVTGQKMCWLAPRGSL